MRTACASVNKAFPIWQKPRARPPDRSPTRQLQPLSHQRALPGVAQSHSPCAPVSSFNPPVCAFCHSEMASNPPAQPPPEQQPAPSTNIITALGNAFKTQTGDPMSGEQIAQLLIQNMPQLGELARQGKLTQTQISQVRITSLILVSSRSVPTIRDNEPRHALRTHSFRDHLVEKHLSTAAVLRKQAQRHHPSSSSSSRCGCSSLHLDDNRSGESPPHRQTRRSPTHTPV